MNNLLMLSTLFLFSACGALMVTPNGCRSDGLWGNDQELGRASPEIKLSKEYFVWNVDYEVKLKDFLKEKHMSCNEVKRIRVEIESTFFVSRKLNVYVTK